MVKQNDLRDDVEEEAPKLLLLLSSDRISGGWTVRAKDDRMFKCKTCDKTFSTFQALGGHRTGHKRLRVEEDAAAEAAAKKRPAHQCPICGIVFSMGQALGGHMRRHKDVIRKNAGGKVDKEDATAANDESGVASELLSGCSDARDDDAAVDGHVRVVGAGNNPRSLLAVASRSSRLGDSSDNPASFDVDLELRLGPTPPRAAAVYTEALEAAFRHTYPSWSPGDKSV